MKNRLLITSLLFAAAGVVSAEDLSVNQSALDASEWSWNDISNWSGGTTLEGSNLTIKGSLSADNTGTIGSALTAGTLTFDINSTSQSKTLLSGNTTFDSIVFNNGNIVIDSQKTNILKVKGDVIVNSLQNVRINNGDARVEFGNIYVTNDRSKGAFTIQGAGTSGVLNMRATEGADGANVVLFLYGQSFTGIDDGGITKNHKITAKWGGNLTLYNVGKNSWSGEWHADRSAIVINGDANKGEQRLNITSYTYEGSGWTDETYKGQQGLKVTVNSGRLILNESSTTHCFIKLNGGTFITEGRIDFIDGVFTGGNIGVTEKGFIAINNAATKNAGVKIGLDFSAITDAEEYYIMSVADMENSDFDFTNAENDFEIKGLNDSLNAALAWNGNTLVATITAAVPEPATVAAILGAIALGFAAYRRRK